jgi:hypothetical protein
MKGLVGSIITLGGFAILFVLFWISFQEIVDAYGGYDAFTQNVLNNPDMGINLVKYEFARDMVVPLYPVNLPIVGQLYIPLDDLSPFFILVIASIVSLVVWKVFSPGWWMLLIVPIVFLTVSTIWLSLWVNLMYSWGNELGMSDEDVHADITATKDLFDVHPWVLWLSLLGAGFVVYRGKGLIKV